MLVIKRNEYKKIYKSMQISFGSKTQCIDVYHKNNWDGFTMHWDEKMKNDCPSYIDFFFDAKEMVDFINKFINSEPFSECFVTPVYNDRYKIKNIDDVVCRDIYDDLKKILNSIGLRITTSCAIKMSKDELLGWIDRFSIGGFCGVSEFSIIIPELSMMIYPHHHMNYLIYTNNKDEMIRNIFSVLPDDILYE